MHTKYQFILMPNKCDSTHILYISYIVVNAHHHAWCERSPTKGNLNDSKRWKYSKSTAASRYSTTMTMASKREGWIYEIEQSTSNVSSKTTSTCRFSRDRVCRTMHDCRIYPLTIQWVTEYRLNIKITLTLEENAERAEQCFPKIANNLNLSSPKDDFRMDDPTDIWLQLLRKKSLPLSKCHTGPCGSSTTKTSFNGWTMCHFIGVERQRLASNENWSLNGERIYNIRMG